MNGKDVHDAMEFVGQDLIDMAEKMTFSPSPWRTLLTAAACAALFLGLGTAALRQLPVHVPEAVQPTVSTDVPPVEAPVTELPEPPADSNPASPEETFYARFPQLERASMEAYVQAHPELLNSGWDKLRIQEAAPGSPGTEIVTTQGDPVLAVDVEQQILLIRVSGEQYQGVLAIANDPGRLRLAPSSQLGIAGETVGTIAQANNGILAINGSAFLDDDGAGDGGLLAGYAMCDGVGYNEDDHLSDLYRRLEIDDEGRFRLAGIQESIGSEVVHAVEFGPALINHGNILVDENCGFMGTHPRAAIGQGENGQILMLVIEGRMPGYSDGANVVQCAQILANYGCRTALNLDGGTSAILWYDGACVTKCSNSYLPEGRPLPTAFVIEAID